MRLAVVEPAPRGGLLHYALQLSSALAERGHDVDLIAARDNEVVELAGGVRMVQVLSALAPPKAQPVLKSRYLAGRARLAMRVAVSWARVVREVRRGRYDAVILGCDVYLPPAALGALVLTALPRRPVLIHICHNVRAFNRGSGQALHSGGRLSSGLLRLLYPRFDLVLVHGERSLAEFGTSWPPTNVAIVSQGDQRLFAAEPPSQSTEERILFFGHWRKVKGLTVLMEAFDELALRRRTVRLTIAGTAWPHDFDPTAMRKWAVEHGERVTLVDGYVPLEEVPGLFAEARVVVTPYLAGYQSGVIQLALTMGRPVVTSDVGDLPAAVDYGLAGRVVPAGDAGALASALDAIVSDSALAASLGAAGRRRLMALRSWDTVAGELEGHLRTLYR